MQILLVKGPWVTLGSGSLVPARRLSGIYIHPRTAFIADREGVLCVYKASFGGWQKVLVHSLSGFI
jgi:hypothetical protein